MVGERERRLGSWCLYKKRRNSDILGRVGREGCAAKTMRQIKMGVFMRACMCVYFF